jgi:hypothetical protein
MQALFMNLVPISSHFFFNSGPKKALSLSLNVKCDQQTHKKMTPSIMASISRKSSDKFPILIFQMLLAERRTHNNRAFFMGSRVFLWVRLWEVKILWVWIMGVTLVYLAHSKLFSHWSPTCTPDDADTVLYQLSGHIARAAPTGHSLMIILTEETVHHMLIVEIFLYQKILVHLSCHKCNIRTPG